MSIKMFFHFIIIIIIVIVKEQNLHLWRKTTSLEIGQFICFAQVIILQNKRMHSLLQLRTKCTFNLVQLFTTSCPPL